MDGKCRKKKKCYKQNTKCNQTEGIIYNNLRVGERGMFSSFKYARTFFLLFVVCLFICVISILFHSSEWHPYCIIHFIMKITRKLQLFWWHFYIFLTWVKKSIFVFLFFVKSENKKISFKKLKSKMKYLKETEKTYNDLMRKVNFPLTNNLNHVNHMECYNSHKINI